MAEIRYRLKTKDGLSKQYTLEYLQQKSSTGSVDESVQCTSDNGDTWVSLGTLIMSGSEIRQRTKQDETTVVSETTQDPSPMNKPEEAEGDDLPGARKLKRLPATSVNSRAAKLNDDQSQPKSAKKSKSPGDLVGVTLAAGRYRILSQFGSGSMAYVFRASDNRLETDVIVKVPKPEKITSDDFRERFRRESQLLVRLSHPHVVTVLDVGEYAELPFVVMQLLSGGTLSDRMKKDSNQLNQMSTESLQTWVREVARALDFCYKRGMVHRDVKPANILFDDDDNAYVSDFGLTKIMHGEHTELNSSGTATGVVLGTPNYLSPEIILGATYDGRADQYSLGMTVYHALCGRPPMQGKSATATMINQTQKKLELLSSFRSDVPRDLALAVQKSIEKKPENRFDTCEEFAQAVLDGLRSPSSSSGVVTQSAMDKQESSAPKVRKRRATEQSSSGSQISSSSHKSSSSQKKPATQTKKKRKKSSSASSAGLESDWLDPIPVKLPPRKGQSAKSSRSQRNKQPRKPQNLVVFGVEMHPAVFALTAALILVPTLIYFYFKFTVSDPDVAVVDSPLPAQFPPAAATTNAPKSQPKQTQSKRSNKSKANAANVPPQNMANSTSKNGSAVQIPVGGPASNPPANPASTQTTSPEPAPPLVDNKAATASDGAGIARQTEAQRAVISSDVQTPLTTGPPGCPVLVAGQEVWNIQSQAVTVRLDGAYDRNAQSALSADGRYFAAGSRPPGQQNTDVTVWDTQSGKKIFTAAGDSKRFVDTIMLSSQALYLGDRWSDELLIWDCEDGRQRKPLQIPQAKLNHHNTTISHDGEYLAAVVQNQLWVIKSDTGKPVAQMENSRANARNSAAKSEAFYASLQSLGFSAGNTELAAVSTLSGTRLLCWNSRGEIDVDRVIGWDLSKTRNPLQWFPERQAWLIGHHIFDRTSERTVLSVEQPADLPTRLHVLDNDHLCGTFASAPTQIKIAKIPWSEINASLSRMTDDTSAHLAPGKSIRIDIRLAPVKRMAGEVETALRKSLKSKLAGHGLLVADQAPATFVVRFTNKGRNLPSIRNRQLPKDQRELSTIEQPDNSVRSLVIELVVPNQPGPVWRINLGSAEALLSVESSDDQKRREQLTDLTETITNESLPYYIPADDDLIALPALLN